MKTLGRSPLVWTHTKFETVQKESIFSETLVWFNRSCVCFKSSGFSIVLFCFNLRISEIDTNPPKKTLFYEYPVKRQLFWLPENNPEIINKTKLPKSHFMFCDGYWYHISKKSFMLLIDIGLMSMILEISLNGS